MGSWLRPFPRLNLRLKLRLRPPTMVTTMVTTTTTTTLVDTVPTTEDTITTTEDTILTAEDTQASTDLDPTTDITTTIDLFDGPESTKSDFKMPTIMHGTICYLF